LAFEIQISNDIVQEWHDLRVDNINLSLVCFANLGKILFSKACLDGKTRQGFCLITSLLKNGTSTKDKGTNSLAMDKVNSSNNFWLVILVMFEGLG
jgi:hypothetical protein